MERILGRRTLCVLLLLAFMGVDAMGIHIMRQEKGRYIFDPILVGHNMEGFEEFVKAGDGVLIFIGETALIDDGVRYTFKLRYCDRTKYEYVHIYMHDGLIHKTMCFNEGELFFKGGSESWMEYFKELPPPEIIEEVIEEVELPKRHWFETAYLSTRNGVASVLPSSEFMYEEFVPSMETVKIVGITLGIATAVVVLAVPLIALLCAAGGGMG